MGQLIANIVSGVGSILDTHNNIHIAEPAKNPSAADAEALRRDWQQVGNDMRSAMKGCGRNGQ